MMARITIIIPVYKVEPYLADCLDSVSRQSCRDFELILVDDGSPDSCPAICDAYAAEHPNVRVIHQENCGLSAARNRGVKEAVTEYITFIDSDDVVAPDYIEYLLHLQEMYNADVAVACSTRLLRNAIPKAPSKDGTEGSVSVSDALASILYGKFPICAWAKLYRRDLVEKNPYPDGKIYEDIATTYRILGDAKRIACSSRTIYYWRPRSGSITHSPMTPDHLYEVEAARDQLVWMAKHFPAVVPAARARLAFCILNYSCHLTLKKADRKLFRQVRSELKPVLRHVLADKNASIVVKFRLLAMACGSLPHWLISRIYIYLKWRGIPEG